MKPNRGDDKNNTGAAIDQVGATVDAISDLRKSSSTGSLSGVNVEENAKIAVHLIHRNPSIKFDSSLLSALSINNSSPVGPSLLSQVTIIILIRTSPCI
jgi:hypothetical protein